SSWNDDYKVFLRGRIALALLDHRVGEREQLEWDLKAERLGGLEIDHKLEPGRLRDRQVGGLLALENTAGVDAALTGRILSGACVADQSAGCDECALSVHRGYTMTRRQRDNWITE